MVNPKICILTETYHPLIGGGETQARSLAEGLVSNGFSVIVLTRRSDASFNKFERYGPVIVYRLPPVGGQHLKKWGLLLTTIPALVRLRGQYDLVLVCGFRVLGIAAVTVSRLMGKNCILKADSLGEMSGEFFSAGLRQIGMSPASILVRAFLKLRDAALKRAHGFVAISSAVKQELAMCGVAGKLVQTIPNSVDTDLFHPVTPEQKKILRGKLGLPAEAQIAAFTGRLVSYKGLPLLLKVWRQIRPQHSDALLLLVGSGGIDIHNCEAELKEFVAAAGIERWVRFAGGVRHVPSYLQASDLFVFPTEREAFGISLIEAMACGLPVVSTAVGGVKDIIEDGQNGLVVEAGHFDQLYCAIEKLMTDPQLRARLGRAARQTAEERYSMTSVTERYIELFRSLAY